MLRTFLCKSFCGGYISRSLKEDILRFIGIYHFSKCLHNFISSQHDMSSCYFRTPQHWTSSVFLVFLTQGSVKSTHGFYLYSTDKDWRLSFFWCSLDILSITECVLWHRCTTNTFSVTLAGLPAWSNCSHLVPEKQLYIVFGKISFGFFFFLMVFPISLSLTCLPSQTELDKWASWI